MPFLPSSGPLSINDIRNLFGGPASPSMANYYRGGAYVPSTKTTPATIFEPPSGDFYNPSYPNFTFVYINGNESYWWWFNTNFGQFFASTTSITSGIYTYYRGSFKQTVVDEYGNFFYYYGIYRSYSGTITVNINTSVPTSGQISISQLYGAEKP